jgi:hypothetical protein
MVQVGRVQKVTEVDDAIKNYHAKNPRDAIYIYIGPSSAIVVDADDDDKSPEDYVVTQADLQPEFSGFYSKKQDNLYTMLGQVLNKSHPDDRDCSIFGVCTDEQGIPHWGGGSHFFTKGYTMGDYNDPRVVSTNIAKATSYLASLNMQFDSEVKNLQKVNKRKRLPYSCMSAHLLQRYFQGRAPDMSVSRLFCLDYDCNVCLPAHTEAPHGAIRPLQTAMKTLSQPRRPVRGVRHKKLCT